ITGCTLVMALTPVGVGQREGAFGLGLRAGVLSRSRRHAVVWPRTRATFPPDRRAVLLALGAWCTPRRAGWLRARQAAGREQDPHQQLRAQRPSDPVACVRRTVGRYHCELQRNAPPCAGRPESAAVPAD